jgi:fermentation-respiration switch protein FrsA (DUF1100 family)
MSGFQKADYSALDRPEVGALIFHPRPELGPPSFRQGVSDHLIGVDQDIKIGARFHMAAPECATILFFHGNGEIAADYDDLGPLYNELGINFMVVDYRGYGRSSGTPMVSTMMRDAHAIFEYVHAWLHANSYNGPLIVMGRSLGSASALELAAGHPSRMDGLIIESGFAFAGPLLQLLGIDTKAIGFKEKAGFANLDKIRTYSGPTLVIHAEFDHIIPYSDGQALYDASPSPAKRILRIDGANHNDIMMRGMGDYLNAIDDFTRKLG